MNPLPLHSYQSNIENKASAPSGQQICHITTFQAVKRVKVSNAEEHPSRLQMYYQLIKVRDEEWMLISKIV